MAKITGPLHSLEATGRFAKDIDFVRHRSGQVAQFKRARRTQRNPRTIATNKNLSEIFKWWSYMKESQVRYSEGVNLVYDLAINQGYSGVNNHWALAALAPKGETETEWAARMEALQVAAEGNRIGCVHNMPGEERLPVFVDSTGKVFSPRRVCNNLVPTLYLLMEPTFGGYPPNALPMDREESLVNYRYIEVVPGCFLDTGDDRALITEAG